MVWFTASVMGSRVSFQFTGFIFFSTLASYSVHWYLTDAATGSTDKRTSWLSANKQVHLVFFILSAVGSTAFLLAELKNFLWILPAVLLTLMYSAPKAPLPFLQNLEQYICGKTFLLAAMWAYVTVALPTLAEGVKWQQQDWIFLANRFALIFAICILFDMRDAEHDRSKGIKSLVTLLKKNHVKTVFTISIVAGILSALFFSQDVWLNAILMLPSFLTYFLYNRSVNTTNDYLFYFILDGLLALSPVLYFLKM